MTYWNIWAPRVALLLLCLYAGYWWGRREKGVDRGSRSHSVAHWYFFVPLAAFIILSLYAGYWWGRWFEVPGETQDWKTFAPPIAVLGAGLLALAVGSMTLFGVLHSSRRTQEDNRKSREQIEADNRKSREQIASDNRATREQSKDAEELKRCWERFTWIVDQVSSQDDSAERFPPEVVTEMLEGLVNDADALKDATLVAVVIEYAQVVGNNFGPAVSMALGDESADNGGEGPTDSGER